MTLRNALTWSPKWFIRHESLWSVARKLATTQLVSLQQVLRRVLCPPKAPSLRLFLVGEAARTRWLKELLGLTEADVAGFWLDETTLGPQDGSVCTGIRFCPSCMRQQFHSTLFQSYLLRTCPVHGDPLTTRCPRCGAFKLAHSTQTDSFAWCAVCDRPYFPEPRDWLQSYRSPEVGQVLAAVQAALARRSGSSHIESSLRDWATQPGRVVPEEMPAFALLGDSLLGHQRPLAQLSCVLGPNEDALCPSWLVSQQIASVAQTALSRLASEVGLPRAMGLPVHARSDEFSRAAHLLVRWLGIRDGQSVAEAARTMRNMSFSPVLSAAASPGAPDGGLVRGWDSQLACILVGIRGVYLDALQWVRSPAAPHSWDQWPVNRDPANFPTVWAGTRDPAGGCNFSLYGPSADLTLAAKSPTRTVGL